MDGWDVPINSIECYIPAGTGYEQSVVVTSIGIPSTPLKALSYGAPTITTIEGCMTSGSKLSTIDCPRNGSQILTVIGTNFGVSGATILLGSAQCGSLTHDSSSPHTILTCILPSGYQMDRSIVVVQLNGAVSSTAASVSYLQCSPGYYQNVSVSPQAALAVCAFHSRRFGMVLNLKNRISYVSSVQ
jgi:hypothetical protein